MSEPNVSAQADLSYLRALAEAGRNAPPEGGSYLLAGGGWFSAAALIIGLGDLGVLAPAASGMWTALLVAMTGFAATLFLLSRRDAGKVATDANRIFGEAWSAAGAGVFFFFVACFVAAARLDSFAIMNAVALFVLTVYAVAWRISAAITRQQWMNAVTGLCVASLGLVAWAVATPYLWLAYAAALFLSAVVPGLILMRQARILRNRTA